MQLFKIKWLFDEPLEALNFRWSIYIFLLCILFSWSVFSSFGHSFGWKQCTKSAYFSLQKENFLLHSRNAFSPHTRQCVFKPTDLLRSTEQLQPTSRLRRAEVRPWAGLSSLFSSELPFSGAGAVGRGSWPRTHQTMFYRVFRRSEKVTNRKPSLFILFFAGG